MEFPVPAVKGLEDLNQSCDLGIVERTTGNGIRVSEVIE